MGSVVVLDLQQSSRNSSRWLIRLLLLLCRNILLPHSSNSSTSSTSVLPGLTLPVSHRFLARVLCILNSSNSAPDRPRLLRQQPNFLRAHTQSNRLFLHLLHNTLLAFHATTASFRVNHLFPKRARCNMANSSSSSVPDRRPPLAHRLRLR